MSTATTTGIESAGEPVARRPNASATADKTGDEALTSDARGQLRKSLQRKYRHVAAVHSQSRPSCLSHDAVQTPSFIGFRNLMVIVLGELILLTLASSLGRSLGSPLLSPNQRGRRGSPL